MKFSLLFLLFTFAAHAGSPNPDALPPPVLKADPSVAPATSAAKKKGRSLASIETVEGADPINAFPESGNVVKAKRQGKCPAGFRIADFHGWLCAKQ